MAKCVTCGKYVAVKDVAACIKCHKKYHFACVHLKESPKPKTEWLCQGCNKTVPPLSTLVSPTEKETETEYESTPSSSTSTTASFKDASEPGALQQDTGLALRVDVGQEIRLFRRELQQLREELRTGLGEIRREVSDLRQTVLTCSQRVDGMESRIEALEKRQEAFASEDLQCKFAQTVAHLKLELNDREQELLSSDLEIANLPEDRSENVIHTVELVARKLGVTLEARDIVFAERVGPKHQSGTGAAEGSATGRERRIVVRLARRGLRDELLRSARVRRGATSADLGLAAPPRCFFLNERLTIHNKQLLYHARQAAESLGWRYTWTKRGRIFTKQADGKRTYSIRSKEDFNRVFGADLSKDNIK